MNLRRALRIFERVRGDGPKMFIRARLPLEFYTPESSDRRSTPRIVYREVTYPPPRRN